MKNRHALCLSLVFAVTASASPSAHAQEGNFDPGWNGNGRRIVDFSSETDVPTQLLVTPDDKVLVAGTCGPAFTEENPTICAARLQPDGALDLQFGLAGDGMVHLSELAGDELTYGAGTARSSDGTLWFAGTTFGTSEISVFRVDEDATSVLGTRVFHFNDLPAQPASLVHAIAAAPDQSVIVAGTALRDGSATRDIAIARLLLHKDTGAIDLDDAFGDSGVVLIDYGSEVTDLRVHGDGRILIGGWKRGAVTTGLSSGFVMQLLANGAIDDSFGTSPGLTQLRLCAGSYNRYGSPPRIALDPEGRIAVGYTAAYRAADFTELNSKICVNRLHPDGLQDGSFGGVQVPGGTGHPVLVDIGGSSYLESIAVGADRKIIVGGTNISDTGVPCAIACFMVARLQVFPRTAMVLDPSFGNLGSGVGRYDEGATWNSGNALAIGNGGLMIAGYGAQFGEPFVPQRFGIAKIQLGLAAFAEIFDDGFE